MKCLWLFVLVTAAVRMTAQTQETLVAETVPIAKSAPAAGGENTAPFIGTIPVVVTTVKVDGSSPDAPDTLTPALQMTQAQILSSAGTYGDFVRALQVLPGVVRSSDLSNDILIRGGHPTENLFVIDGIEVPNINHFALSGTNGGLTSMVDSAAVGSMELRADGYDAGYSSRLSSLIEIRTHKLSEAVKSREFSAGIDGAGGIYQRTLRHKGSLLLSAHRSIVSLLTNDIGINGVPVYSNVLTRLEVEPSSRDSVMLLTLSGTDSIAMTPCPSDSRATSTIETQYAGWRTTGALSWVHSWSPAAAGTLAASYSATSQKIGQQQQSGFLYNAAGVVTCQPAILTPVYNEDSRTGLSTLTYQVRAAQRGWSLLLGVSSKLVSPRDNVAQPVGQLSPFSVSAARSDAVSFGRNFASGQSAGFMQAGRSIGARWQILMGVRAETFALDGSYAIDPRVAITYKLNARQAVHGSLSAASQLPPTMDLLSYAANRSLRPIEVRQGSLGMRLWQGGWGTLDAEAYEKNYVREPVSTEYPQLILSNMVDTLGQAFAWLPLASAGSERAEGLELTLRAHWQDRMEVLVSMAQSQATYRALDGVRRRGNYDTPTMVNAMGTLRLAGGLARVLRQRAPVLPLRSGRLQCADARHLRLEPHQRCARAALQPPGYRGGAKLQSARGCAGCSCGRGECFQSGKSARICVDAVVRGGMALQQQRGAYCAYRPNGTIPGGISAVSILALGWPAMKARRTIGFDMEFRCTMSPG